MTYAEHIQQIAKQHDIRVNVKPGMPAEQATSDGHLNADGTESNVVINIAPVVDDKSYLIALHELGHALGRREARNAYAVSEAGRMSTLFGIVTGQIMDFIESPNDRRLWLQQEIDASQWAYETAIRWTDAMSASVRGALGSYIVGRAGTTDDILNACDAFVLSLKPK